MKICVIIPVYNHHRAIRQVVNQLKPFGLFCILVNDGSSAECSMLLTAIAKEEKEWLMLFERHENGGKGAAVVDGFLQAIEKGFTHAIQIDADGQHNTQDIKRFADVSKRNPKKMVLGQPSFDASVPKSRLYGRKITTVWIWINTLSFAIADGLCGFRCYPLTAVNTLINSETLGQRMDFDIDIVVRLYWQGLNVINLTTEVNYPQDGVSHFKMLRDNFDISKTHAQLFFGMLIRFPKLLMRHLQ